MEFNRFERLIGEKATINDPEASTDVAAGMATLVGDCRELCEHALWDDLARLDFNADAATFGAWLRAAFECESPPASVNLLWFMLPAVEDAEAAAAGALEIAGHEGFSQEDDEMGWIERGAYSTPTAPWNSAVLGTLRGRAWRDFRDASPLFDLLDYFLATGYVGLCVAHFAAAGGATLLAGTGKGRFALVGPAEGEDILLGRATAAGWEPNQEVWELGFV